MLLGINRPSRLELKLPVITDIVNRSSFTKEVNLQLAQCPLKTNGHLANLGLTSLVKEATGCEFSIASLGFVGATVVTTSDGWNQAIILSSATWAE